MLAEAQRNKSAIHYCAANERFPVTFSCSSCCAAAKESAGSFLLFEILGWKARENENINVGMLSFFGDFITQQPDAVNDLKAVKRMYGLKSAKLSREMN